MSGMKVWIVIVLPYMGVRYTDSMWASEEAATERVGELETAWNHAKNAANGHRAIIQDAKLADVVIVNPQTEARDLLSPTSEASS